MIVPHLHAQTATLDGGASGRRAVAVRVDSGRIQVDGALDEREWELASPADGFRQQQPAEGQPATEQTEIRFLYDSEMLYVGGRLFDSEPDKLLTNELKRDFNARDGDLFVLVLDTFHDRRNSYGFQTNPMGAQREIQTYDDGRVVNQNWDTVWYLKTSRFDRGWLLEFGIPFKSLRFAEHDVQVWGLNIFRLIRRKNEITLWMPVPRQYNQFKVSYAGILEGISGVKPGRDFRVKPFFTSQLTRTRGGTAMDADGGLDMKLGIGTGLVLDGTVRTDFSQVEADEQQINLTRFSLFFPEKREFFLENQGAFQAGPPTPFNNNMSLQQSGPPDLIPFFSRRIGLSDRGTPIPILGGARLSGKVGRSTLGILNIQTDQDPGAAEPDRSKANFSVLRYSREVLANSSVGAFYLGKEIIGASNRIVGSDLRLNLRRRLDIDALWMRSTKEHAPSGTSWRLGFNFEGNLTRYSASYTVLGKNFRDELGFIPREGVDILNLSFVRRFRPRSTYRVIREYRGELPYTRYGKDGLGVETATLSPSFYIDFADGSLFRATFRHNEEALTNPFRIRSNYSIRPGRYRFTDEDIELSSSRARRVSVTGGWRTGEFWHGTRSGYSAGGRVRFSPKLATQLSYAQDRVRLPGASFLTSRSSLRVDGSFSTRMFLNAFIQYNNVTRETFTNVRFNVIHRPLSDLFVVYNESRFRGQPDATRRSVILKFTQLFSF